MNYYINCNGRTPATFADDGDRVLCREMFADRYVKVLIEAADAAGSES